MKSLILVRELRHVFPLWAISLMYIIKYIKSWVSWEEILNVQLKKGKLLE